MNTRRYQIFVCSTYEDLKEERQEILQVILRMQHFPAGMELFTGVNDPKWEVIKGVLDQCDYLVLILAGRYGEGFIEREYDYARENNIPILALVHKDTGLIPQNKCEVESENRKKLELFRNKVSNNVVAYWTSDKELVANANSGLIDLIAKHNRPGWQRVLDSNVQGNQIDKLTTARSYELDVQKAKNMPYLNISGTSSNDRGWKLEFRNDRGECKSLKVSVEPMDVQGLNLDKNGYFVSSDKTRLNRGETCKLDLIIKGIDTPQLKNEVQYKIHFLFHDLGNIPYLQTFTMRGAQVVENPEPIEQPTINTNKEFVEDIYTEIKRREREDAHRRSIRSLR